MVSSLEDQNGRVSIDRGEPLPGETSKGIAIAAVLIGPNGSVLDHSSSVSNPAVYAALAERGHRRLGVLSAVIDSRPERVLLRPVETGDDRSAVLVLARPIDELEVSLRRSRSC